MKQLSDNHQRKVIDEIPECLIKEGWAIPIFSSIKNNGHFFMIPVGGREPRIKLLVVKILPGMC